MLQMLEEILYLGLRRMGIQNFKLNVISRIKKQTIGCRRFQLVMERLSIKERLKEVGNPVPRKGDYMMVDTVKMFSNKRKSSIPFVCFSRRYIQVMRKERSYVLSTSLIVSFEGPNQPAILTKPSLNHKVGETHVFENGFLESEKPSNVNVHLLDSKIEVNEREKSIGIKVVPANVLENDKDSEDLCKEIGKKEEAQIHDMSEKIKRRRINKVDSKWRMDGQLAGLVDAQGRIHVGIPTR